MANNDILLDWNASTFFQQLVQQNLLAQSYNFTFCKVSGLDGFEEALHQMLNATALVCVSDIADGYTELDNTPRTRRIKTVFLAMRHAVDDMDARTECMETMRELFRQFMSVLIREKIKLEQNHIYLDQRISFNEIDRYFFSGGACAYFQIAADIFTNLVYNPQEWSEDVVGNEEPKYVANFSIWLTYVPSDSELKVVKLLKNQFQFSLKAATSLTKNTPSLLFENSSKEYFYEIKPLFDEYEAIITIKPKQA